MIQLFARIALSLGFFLPVMDRLGFLGAPGSNNVAWGNWENFRAYTGQILPFLGEASLNLAAVLATIMECILAVCLLIGFKTKLAGLGTAILTAIFGISMFIFLGRLAPFAYPVFVFTAAGALLWTKEDFKWSLDNYFKSRAD